MTQSPPKPIQSAQRVRLMRVVVKPGSAAERRHHPRAQLARPEARAGGFPPTPEHDLKYRGGRTIAHLQYLNFYVGGSAAWKPSDVDNIDQALEKAMSDPRLNNVMRQYFANQPITTEFLGSHFTGTQKPKRVNETSVRKLVASLFATGQLSGLDFASTVVNILLPSGTILTDGTGNGSEKDGDDGRQRRSGTPEAEESSSLEGLGGYHGSLDTAQRRIYYAVGVYSERLPSGRENGIAVFEAPWKNVVGTFYHELNEARTDPDVDEAIRTNKVDGIIGWNSDDGEECGDFPVFEADSNLAAVFKEVAVAGGTVPVQFQYSNAVHGPEGPIKKPHPLNIGHEMAA